MTIDDTRVLAPAQHVFPHNEWPCHLGRNERIRNDYARIPPEQKRGALARLAAEHELSSARIHQIVFGRASR